MRVSGALRPHLHTNRDGRVTLDVTLSGRLGTQHVVDTRLHNQHARAAAVQRQREHQRLGLPALPIDDAIAASEHRVQTLRERRVRCLLATVDTDGDGRVEPLEYAELLMVRSPALCCVAASWQCPDSGPHVVPTPRAQAVRLEEQVPQCDARARQRVYRLLGAKGSVGRAELAHALTQHFDIYEEELVKVELYAGLPSRPDGAEVPRRVAALVAHLDGNDDGRVDATELVHLFAAVEYQTVIDGCQYDAEEEARDVIGEGETLSACDLFSVVGGYWMEPENEHELAAAERILGINERHGSTERRVRAMLAAMDLDHDGRVSFLELKHVLLAARVQTDLDRWAPKLAHHARRIAADGGIDAGELHRMIGPQFERDVHELEAAERYLDLPVRPDGADQTGRVKAMIAKIDQDANGRIEAAELVRLFTAVAAQNAIDVHAYDAEDEARELAGEDGVTPSELWQLVGAYWASPEAAAELEAAEKFLGIAGGPLAEQHRRERARLRLLRAKGREAQAAHPQRARHRLGSLGETVAPRVDLASAEALRGRRVRSLLALVDTDGDGRVEPLEYAELLMAVRVEMQAPECDRRARDRVRRLLGRGEMFPGELARALTAHFAGYEEELRRIELYLCLRPSDDARVPQRAAAVVERLDRNAGGTIDVAELTDLFAAVEYQTVIEFHKREAEEEARQMIGVGNKISTRDLFVLVGAHWAHPGREAELAAAERIFGLHKRCDSAERRVRRMFAAVDLDHDGRVSFLELKHVLLAARVQTDLDRWAPKLAHHARRIAGDGGIGAGELHRMIGPQFERDVHELEAIERYLGLPAHPDGADRADRVKAMIAKIDQDANGRIEAAELVRLFTAVAAQNAIDVHAFDAEDEARELAGEDGVTPSELWQLVGAYWASPEAAAELEAAEKFLGIAGGLAAEQEQHRRERARLRLLRARMEETHPAHVFEHQDINWVEGVEEATVDAELQKNIEEEQTRLRVRRVFGAFDLDDDGLISMKEVKQVLLAVQLEMEAGGIDLKSAEAARQMVALDDSPGDLTFEEFQRWHHRADTPASQLTVDEARRLTNLGAYSATQLLPLFGAAVESGGTIKRQKLRSCFDEVLGDRGHLSGADDEDKLRVLVGRLYDVFDTNGDGVVDFDELSSGLSVLCGGSADARAEAAFKLYNYNGDGVISQQEMTRYLTSVFTMMYKLEPSTQGRMGGASAAAVGGAGGGGGVRGGRLGRQRQPDVRGVPAMAPPGPISITAERGGGAAADEPGRVLDDALAELFSVRQGADGTITRDELRCRVSMRWSGTKVT